MSRQDAEDKSLRELVRYSINMMEEHKLESSTFRNTTTRHLSELSLLCSEMKTHSEYAKMSIEAHKAEIANMKANENKVKGFLWLLTLLGLGGIAKYFWGN